MGICINISRTIKRRIFLHLILVIFSSFCLLSLVIVEWRMNAIEKSWANYQSSRINQFFRDKPDCVKPTNLDPSKLVINTSVPTFDEVDRLFPHIQEGGHWQPDHCKQNQKVAILVPFRDRWNHLPVFLRHMHQLLVRQQRHYTIYVIEQAEGAPFNRGKILNIGAIESLKLEPDLNCFILHDVDTLPETNFAHYECPESSALQLAVYQTKMNFEYYKNYAGGVLAVRRSIFENINGFSNEFWGWGEEDDDLANRLDGKGYKVVQDLSAGAHFYSLGHTDAVHNPNNERILEEHLTNLHLYGEGLNSTVYSVLKMERRNTFTLISVQL